jgi:hypothetical protein
VKFLHKNIPIDTIKEENNNIIMCILNNFNLRMCPIANFSLCLISVVTFPDFIMAEMLRNSSLFVKMNEKKRVKSVNAIPKIAIVTGKMISYISFII